MYTIGCHPESKTVWIFQSPTVAVRQVYECSGTHTLLGVAYEIAKSTMQALGYESIMLKLANAPAITMI